jgi:hypothetical protein
MLKSALDWERVRTLRAVVPHHVVHRTLASETVLLNIDTGHYYGMDESGGRFFTVLSEAASIGSAVDLLSREFEAPLERIREDALRYCSELLELGLIELHDTAGKDQSSGS